MKICTLVLSLLLFMQVNAEPLVAKQPPTGLRIAGMSPYLVAAVAAIFITGCVMRRRAVDEIDNREEAGQP